MRHGHSQLGDFLFQLNDKRIEFGDFAGILTLFLLAKAVDVGLVLRPPAVKEEAILLDDGLSQLFHLIELRAARNPDTGSPFFSRSRHYFATINSERIFPRR